MRLKNKVAIVTGGSSGIGRATALLFSEHGAIVVIADINSIGGQSTVNKIVDNGGKALYVESDLTKTSDVLRVVNETKSVYGSIDILHNNAGILLFGDVTSCSEEEWDRVLAINLKAAFLLSKYVIPEMIKQNYGVVIHTASIGGLVGVENATAYAASKGGIIQLTRSMALDYGKFNIRVNCICPGSTETPMLHSIWETEGAAIGKDLNSMREIYKEGRPLRKIATPVDIAYAALYLASDESQFVTGTCLVVDGGITAM
jgi:NAD(P)-dependent dehydrogenase (short-subunit alcohol dehydrogenase family)